MTIKDPARVVALFDIVAKQSTVHPGFGYIGSEASAELREINETIRKTHEAESGKPVTPAPVGDRESPAQSPPPGMENSPDFATHPTASTPADRPIAADTPAPPVDERY